MAVALFEHERKIRVAVVGYGWVSKNFHTPLINSVKGLDFSVIGTNRIEEVKAECPAFRVLRSEDAATDDQVDLVVIAGVNADHVRLAKIALSAGKHVVVEKPFTPTLEEARELAALADANNCLLSVFQNRRWDSDFLTVKDAIANGLMGSVLHFESHIDRYSPTVPNAWREKPTPAGGTWFDLGPHIADQALLLFGIPKTITANFAQQRDGAQTDDWFNVVFEYDKLRVVLHAAQYVVGGSFRFAVHGTAASLIKYGADPQEAQMINGGSPADADWGIDPDDAWLFKSSDRTQRELLPASRGDQGQYYASIDRALRGQGANPVTPHQAVVLMAVLETAARAAAIKTTLELDLSDEERKAFPT
ncbi:oxidoreductase [Glaciimonas sp. PCH181]|uniref:oxidoreductase n=1 Tax=Glaciimonas sp. PCH181 TaxID=2133943 RepID=UPI000D3D98F1|nr:oxidoreductase [Glaciimonas sp. PCH181]PUA18438.1 oxidoreductase [Glaciimonas sp. PCH181]